MTQSPTMHQPRQLRAIFVQPLLPLTVALLVALALGAIPMSSDARHALAAESGPNTSDPERMRQAQSTPRPSTPSAATPMAGGCGNAASGPTEIAEVFLAAATAENLERAARCFAPEHQPRDWDDIFLGGNEDAWDDVTGCRGLPYVVRASEIRAGVSAIIFTFEEACAVARLDPWQRQLYDADSTNVSTIVVQTYHADGRWWVRDAFALVAD